VSEVPNIAAARVIRVLFGAILVAIGAGFWFLYVTTMPAMEAALLDALKRDLLELAALYRADGTTALEGAIDRRLSLDPAGKAIYCVTGPTGTTTAGNLSEWPAGLEPDGRWHQIQLRRAGAAQTEPMWASAIRLPGGYGLLVGHAVATRTLFARNIGFSLIGVVGAAALLTWFAVRVISRHSQSRLDAFAGTAAAVMRGDLAHRFGVHGAEDEFDQLATSLNTMLARVEELMTAMRVVTDGIAHDFRTPLTRLRTRLDLALQRDDGRGAQREVLVTAINEADALVRNLNALLEIARAEAGFGREQMVEVDLAEMIRSLGDLYVPVAEERGITLTVEASSVAKVHGHRELLAQAIANLIENAIKYSRDSTQIALRAGSGVIGAYVVIADRGPGIPEVARDEVVRRFVRLDHAEEAAGSGLGLSLVAAVAKLHGAIFSLRDNEPGLRAVLQFVVTPGG
jgi:signal transduction histidine kinase